VPTVETIGKEPYWRPRSRSDRALVASFAVLHVVFYAPVRLAHALLGRTRASWVALDLLSLPGKILLLAGSAFGKRGRAWGMKANALEHTEFVCRLCPASRQALRDPHGKGACAWNRSWNEGRFGIPPDFGVRNYVGQFRGRTNLVAFASLAAAPATPASGAPRRRLPAPLLWALSGAFWAALVVALVLLA
jgi:hypothetical protein